MDSAKSDSSTPSRARQEMDSAKSDSSTPSRARQEMDSPAKSDSSGGRRPRIRKLDSQLTPLKFKDNGDDEDDLTIGFLSLNKPSGIRDAPNWAREVCLDLANPSDQFLMRILTEIRHKNILHLETTLQPAESDKSTVVKICVGKYTESLYHFASELRISQHRGLEMIQKLLRQVVEGLDELRLHGFYHGNLNIHSTYFDRPTGLIKLANFTEKGEHELLHAQLLDWRAAGSVVEEISALQNSNDPNPDCYLLDDLATKLKNLPSYVMLNQIKDEVLGHVFFWNRPRISSFFVYSIQAVIDDPDFITRVKNLQCIPIDWNKNDHGGLLNAMIKYRKEQGIPDYGKEKDQYIKFVSGAYTHEDELKEKLPHLDVNKTIKKHCPHLCLELVKIAWELGYPV